MTRPRVILIALLWTNSLVAVGAPGEQQVAAAKAYFEASGLPVENALQLETLADLQIKASPNLAPYRDTLLGFYRKVIAWDQIEGAMVDLYANAFTAEELGQMTAFFRTNTGMKLSRTLPTLAVQAGRLREDLLRNKMDDLRQLMAQQIQASALPAIPTSTSVRQP